MRKQLLLAAAVLAATSVTTPRAQQLPLPDLKDADLGETIAQLAEEIIPRYQDADRAVYLTKLYRFHLAAGRYTDSVSAIVALREVAPPAAMNQYAAVTKHTGCKLLDERCDASFLVAADVVRDRPCQMNTDVAQGRAPLRRGFRHDSMPPPVAYHWRCAPRFRASALFREIVDHPMFCQTPNSMNLRATGS